jgi:hypothetical protein
MAHTSPAQKAFSKKATTMARQCWNEGINDLVRGDGLDTSGLTFAHGGLALGAYAGLWTYNVAAGEFHQSAAALLAFEAFAKVMREEVFYKLLVLLHWG